MLVYTILHQYLTGVLTKPDMIPLEAKTSKEFWLDVNKGRIFTLALGYFCTRQLAENERAASIGGSAARLLESSFFSWVAPWSTSMHLGRFGMNEMMGAIYRHLTRIMDQRSVTLTDL